MERKGSLSILLCLSFFVNSYCQYTTPAQWAEIRAARERNEARNREERNSQTKAQNNRQEVNSGSPGTSGSGSNRYSQSTESKEDTYTYENASKIQLPVIRAGQVSDKYFPTIKMDAPNAYGIYSGGKKLVMVYKTYGSNKGNYELNHFELYGRGSFEVFNTVTKDGVYEGNWDGRKMSGTYTNKLWQEFSGNFDNFEIYGEGTLAERGIIYKGIFTDGVLTRIVSINYGEGIVYEGETSGKQRNGRGYLTYKNGGIQYLGNWTNDKKNGEGAMILENGNHLIGSWVDDKQEGEFKLYDPAYVFIKTINYKGGIIVKNISPKAIIMKQSTVADKIKAAPVVKKPLIIADTKNELNAKTPEEFVQPLTGFDKKEELKEDRAVVSKNGKYGYLNENGKLVVPLIYDYAVDFEEGLGAVMLGDNYGFIDKAGKVIIPIMYQQTGFWFHDGFIGVKVNGKWGYINKANKAISAFIYDESYAFKEGLAGVSLNKKWGFIDNKGKVIIQLKYDVVFPFENGLSSVSIEKKWGYVNLLGEEVIPVIYDDIYPPDKGIIKAKTKGVSFYFDTKGKPVTQ